MLVLLVAKQGKYVILEIRTRPATDFNSHSFSSQGGAVRIFNATVTMGNITAIGNIATSVAGTGGGVVYADTSSQVIVSDSFFANNTAMYRGGSFYIATDSNLSLKDCNFVNGSAVNSRGGDMHIAQSKVVWDGGSSVGPFGDYNNSFVNSGGSISVDTSAAGEFTNLNFKGQRVGSFGAVIYASFGCTATMTNISTNDTQAALAGGVIYSVKARNKYCAYIDPFLMFLVCRSLHPVM